MKLAKAAFLVSAMALAVGGAYADKAPKNDPEPGFNNMDKDNDGKLTRAEAVKDKSLLGKWKEADRDGDGSLSRSEYLIVKGKKDLNTAKEKVTNLFSSDEKSESGSSAGRTSGSSTTK